jgi:hypothetical protein
VARNGHGLQSDGEKVIEYTIDEPRRLIRVRMSGANTLTDLLQHFSNLSDDPKFDGAFNAIFLITEDAKAPTELLDNVFLKMAFEQWELRRKHAKWAVVSPNRSQLALAQRATENANLKSVQLRFFDDEESALIWCGSDANSP